MSAPRSGVRSAATLALTLAFSQYDLVAAAAEVGPTLAEVRAEALSLTPHPKNAQILRLDSNPDGTAFCGTMDVHADGGVIPFIITRTSGRWGGIVPAAAKPTEFSKRNLAKIKIIVLQTCSQLHVRGY